MSFPASQFNLAIESCEASLPILVTNTSLLDSGLLCPGCRKTGRRLSLPCSAECSQKLKVLLDEIGSQLTRSGIRFASFWSNKQGSHIALVPNVRSPRAFILTEQTGDPACLTDMFKKELRSLPHGSAHLESALDRLACRGIVQSAEKDLFMPLIAEFRAFLNDARLRLKDVESFMPKPATFTSDLQAFTIRVHRLAAKAFHPDKNEGSERFRHHLESEFWKYLVKPPEKSFRHPKALASPKNYEYLMAYPGLDLEERSPVTWRFGKFIGWLSPDITALRKLLASVR